ncbi:MAG: transcriptional regulator NrdR [Oscillospiraceae bacterium]|nr:transcriptional regulator NrdR [Oscillospiraceae bacterium]
MKCPFCPSPESKVIDSRPTDEGSSIRRRRQCLRCRRRFTTYETIDAPPMIVYKRGGSMQPYDRAKLMRSLVVACDKRLIGMEQLEKIVSDIEHTLKSLDELNLTTKKIGELALDSLRKVDEVAYIRFASVHRQFTDISSFLAEIDALRGKGPAGEG